jgi:histidinol-phosphatase (PHP family)
MLKQWQANYHTHTPWCDGQGTLEEFIRVARHGGLRSLGFSPHGILPFRNDWVLHDADVPEYKAEFLRLKEKYCAELDLFWGVEADYIPLLCDPLSQKKQYQFDYVIGSIHYLEALPDGSYWVIDGSLKQFENGLAVIFHGNIRKAVTRYYAVLREMVLRYPPDIIGHLDLIKMHNFTLHYFSEEEDWYREEIEETLRVIAASPCVVEVNTGGLTRQRAPDYYPSPWIIGKCVELGIPLTINSDAHKPEQLTGYFSEALSYLEKFQCRKLMTLTAGGWQNVLA